VNSAIVTTTTGRAPVPNEGHLLAALRDLMPRRATPLNLDEALQIAERQAGRLRRELGLHSTPALPTSIVGALPFVRVTHEPQLPAPGLLLGTDLGWVIALNAEDIHARQRFTTLHELKHLLDDPFVTGAQLDPLAERVCNHFAACALMPRGLIKRDWGNRIQHPATLAKRYAVSLQAMTIRLRTIGLVTPLRRGDRPDLNAAELRQLATKLRRAWQPPAGSVPITEAS